MADDLPSIAPPPAPEMVPETVLIRQLNIAPKKIRALRPATVQVRHADGVFWPLPDARALATHLGVAYSEVEKNPRPDDVEKMTVCSDARGAEGFHFPNRHIIKCERADGSVVDVRVVDSRKYRRTLRIGGAPMVLEARKADGNWWILVGREPRWVAQW